MGLVWVRNLPAGQVVRWCSPEISPARAWSGGWVEAHSTDPGAPDDLLWRVEAPLPGSDEVRLYGGVYGEQIIEWPADLVRYEVIEPDEAHWPAVEGPGWHVAGPLIVDAAAPIGEDLDPESRDRLDEANRAGSGRRFLRRAAAWSPTAVSAALQYWAGHVIGRPDVQFRWHDDPAPQDPVTPTG